MTQANAILGLLAQTSIHAGTGQSTGAIDLPIQREGHNGYPCIFGSAVKGALRAHAENEHGKEADEVIYSFGPKADGRDANEYAGAALISDARILLMPVRSLTSQFKWVTCPAILNRYQQDAKRFGLDLPLFTIPAVPAPSDQAEAVAVIPETPESNKSNKDNSLFLEEYRFTTQEFNLTGVINALADIMETSNDSKTTLQQQLAVISDDMFSHLCQHATPVNAHIAIDSTTKVVKPGALWYEETLPPETLLYIGISAHAARKRQDEENKGHENLSAKAMLSNITSLFVEKPWLQIGGNETVGMGWCAVKKQKGA